MGGYGLDGKVAIVTGAAQGIGRAVAERFAQEGMSVTLSDVNAERVTETARRDRGRRRPSRGGHGECHRRRQRANSSCARPVEAFGRLDVLVNNAGVGAVAPLLDTDEATWDLLMDVNAKGVLLCTQAAARQMIAQGGGGRIINNASGAGKIAPGRHPLGAYAASKHAVIALTKQFGLELAPHHDPRELRVRGNRRHGDVGSDRRAGRRARACAGGIGEAAGSRVDPGRPHRAARGRREHDRVPRLRPSRLHHRDRVERLRRTAPVLKLQRYELDRADE